MIIRVDRAPVSAAVSFKGTPRQFDAALKGFKRAVKEDHRSYSGPLRAWVVTAAGFSSLDLWCLAMKSTAGAQVVTTTLPEADARPGTLTPEMGSRLRELLGKVATMRADGP